MISDMNKKTLLNDMTERMEDSIEALRYYYDIEGPDSEDYKYHATRLTVLRNIRIDYATGECPIDRREIVEEIAELCYEKSRLERMLRALDTEIEEQIGFYAEELGYEL